MTSPEGRGRRRGLAEVGLMAATVLLGMVALIGSAPRLAPTEVLRISAGEVPPHMDGFGAGREAEVIRAALRGSERDNIQFHVGPFSRHWEAYARDPRLDGATTVPADRRLPGYVSEPYIAYQNGVIYRRADFPQGLGANPLASLTGRRVVAFADASGILPGLAERVPYFASYAEYDDQYVHSAMLARGAVDVVIADRLIVDAYSRQVLGPRYDDPDQRLMFDPVFCPTWYRMVFRSEALGAEFDRGLAAAQASGELARINAAHDARARIASVNRPAPQDCRP